jgi:hypothetical protein
MSKVKKIKRVRMDELGLYLNTIELDHKPRTNKERAELVTKYFNVKCLEEDVDNYERLLKEYDYIVQEDYELESRRLESRRQEYFSHLGFIFI